MTALQRYIAGLYERCVDAGLDVEATRLYLASRGVLRTPAQVDHDLEHVYSFAGYADSHPAPAKISLLAVDREIERLPKSVLNRALSRSALRLATV